MKAFLFLLTSCFNILKYYYKQYKIKTNMSNLAELKKLYQASRRVNVEIGEKIFVIEKPSDIQWPRLLDLMSKAEEDNSNVTLIIKDRVKGWDKVCYSDVFEDIEEEKRWRKFKRNYSI